MRINRYLAASGVCSRREAEKLVLAGRVRVNGQTMQELSAQIEDADRVEVDGKPVHPPENTVVYAYYKPVGVTVSLKDPKQRRLLGDYLDAIPERVVPVGRLDKDSSGLLLLTNDGALVHRLTHPSFEKEKVYEVQLDRMPKGRDIAQFEQGILLDGKKTKPAVVKRTGNGLRIILREGRNRQIRRMWEQLGYRVMALHRTEMDGIQLATLAVGSFRKLTPGEVRRLR